MKYKIESEVAESVALETAALKFAGSSPKFVGGNWLYIHIYYLCKDSLYIYVIDKAKRIYIKIHENSRLKTKVGR